MAEHKNLWEALSAAQAEFPTMPKDAVNPHFKSHFTPLDTIVEKVVKILAAHGLTWSSKPGFTQVNGGGDIVLTLEYTLGHGASGETDSGVMALLPVKKDPQGQGSAITYARRYAICAHLNIVADEDMDGETDAPKAAAKSRAEATAKPASPGAIGAAKVSELAAAYKASGWKTPDDEDPDKTLRMQLAAAGGGNEGPIVDCIKALTASQAATVLGQLVEAAA